MLSGVSGNASLAMSVAVKITPRSRVMTPVPLRLGCLCPGCRAEGEGGDTYLGGSQALSVQGTSERGKKQKYLLCRALSASKSGDVPHVFLRWLKGRSAKRLVSSPQRKRMTFQGRLLLHRGRRHSRTWAPVLAKHKLGVLEGARGTANDEYTWEEVSICWPKLCFPWTPPPLLPAGHSTLTFTEKPEPCGKSGQPFVARLGLLGPGKCLTIITPTDVDTSGSAASGS